MDKAEHIKKARMRLQARYYKKQAAIKALHEQATKDCESILLMIIRMFEPLRVYQWGSLLRPAQFREYSDIDLAVEGITSPQAYFDMLEEAQAMTRFPVDLVQMEKILPEFADSIRQYGRIVYERKG